MYCPTCLCQYPDLLDECPPCGMLLRTGQPERASSPEHADAERLLTDMLRKQGGEIHIDTNAIVVPRFHRYTFPYFGFGFAWAHRMLGVLGDGTVTLQASKVGMRRRLSFPYLGRGYAWVEEMTGNVIGCPLLLTAVKVEREDRWGFPYLGYGYAWTAEMEGRCGDSIAARLVTRLVGRRKEYRFPYRGHGYAWEESAILYLRSTT